MTKKPNAFEVRYQLMREHTNDRASQLREQALSLARMGVLATAEPVAAQALFDRSAALLHDSEVASAVARLSNLGHQRSLDEIQDRLLAYERHPNSVDPRAYNGLYAIDEVARTNPAEIAARGLYFVLQGHIVDPIRVQAINERLVENANLSAPLAIAAELAEVA